MANLNGAYSDTCAKSGPGHGTVLRTPENAGRNEHIRKATWATRARRKSTKRFGQNVNHQATILYSRVDPQLITVQLLCFCDQSLLSAIRPRESRTRDGSDDVMAISAGASERNFAGRWEKGAFRKPPPKNK